MICRIGLFGIYQSHIALCEIRFRTVTGVRTVLAITQIRALSEKGGRAEEVRVVYSFWRLCWDLENLTRTQDMWFYLHLCVSLHYICIGAPKR
mgnify:CR=1 FL=1